MLMSALDLLILKGPEMLKTFCPDLAGRLKEATRPAEAAPARQAGGAGPAYWAGGEAIQPSSAPPANPLEAEGAGGRWGLRG